MSDNNEQGSEDKSVIRCRGLPWSTTADELVEFFSECQLANGTESIHLTLTREGRPSGEAYIEMATEEDVELALKKDRQNMGKRYVEVFKAKKSEMDWVIRRAAGGHDEDESNGDNVVRIRGLPYEATKQDIVSFFDGLEITNNGILLTTDYQGRASGEAFVQFVSDEQTEKALEKNKQSMGHRYIEVFRSSMMEAQKSQMMSGPGAMRGGRGGPMMRGVGGGRPGPYDRMAGPQMGRGYGAYGPAAVRGSRNVKSFGGGGDGFYGNNNGGYGGGGGYGGRFGPGGPPGPAGPRFVVHMRGLPYRVTENDIAEWFSSVVDPIDICIRFNNQGRPTGEANVLFASESDARKAMTKDRQNMQHRYVELFYDGPSGGGMGRGGPGGPPMGGGYGRPAPAAGGFNSSMSGSGGGYSGNYY